ncbi:TonB-dependent receptor domain-containing protein [Formosa sp. S-31]|uniref:TonB-dependent receptor n=1 Tax=Formosa sp. S-31 TaxID=2790949 RepID=UPI003EBD071D
MYFRLQFLLLFLLAYTVFAQENKIQGVVTDETGSPLINVVVYNQKTSESSFTNEQGKFELSAEPGSHALIFTMVGFIKQNREVIVKNQSLASLQIILKPDPSFALNDVLILGKSSVRQVEETGFNVVAIDAKAFHNSAVDLTKVLEQAPGVKIQQEGGLGSRTNVSINGLSGRHVRFFIDGMPMDAMSSAFQINNLPVNLADRIEVYKGVVPVNFGSDALGGAINIVTKKTPGRYIDASYSFGSFNTHQTFINTGYTSKSGFTVQLSAFQNYSDNDYYVDATIKDFETNLLSKTPQRVRRFHDMYRNETLISKIGVVNKTFADQLLFGFTLGKEYDQIQHPAYLNLAFGEKYYTSNIVMPSIMYNKKNLFTGGLDFNLAANYNFGGGHNVDVSDKEYNWLGNWIYSKSPGEAQYSDYIYNDHNGTVNANLNYSLTANHRFTINNVSNFFSRQGDERVVEDDYMNEEPRTNNRNILGISFNSDLNDKFSVSIFGKMYHYKASAYLDLSNQNGIDNFQTVTKKDTKYGYGTTATYFLGHYWQLKANYELTCRLPVSNELFGEVFGFYLANFDLRPETSQNINIGFNFNYPFKQTHVFSTDVNLFYRRTTDFIRLNVNYSQGEGSYVNTELVKTPGIDAELRYSYSDRFKIGASVSYLKPQNFTKGTTYYKSILPNQPTFFSNLDATYFIKDLWLNQSQLGLSYNLQFVDEFLYDYSTYQAANRASVPTQFSHDIFLTYSWKNGKYNMSVDCKNIFDTKLYDNFSLQKPGRRFSLKFRYYFNKL